MTEKVQSGTKSGSMFPAFFMPDSGGPDPVIHLHQRCVTKLVSPVSPRTRRAAYGEVTAGQAHNVQDARDRVPETGWVIAAPPR
jgi:hypothetical protein